MAVYSRRELIKSSAFLVGLGLLDISWNSFGAIKKKKYRLGICDWSIRKESQTEALAYAKKIGLDGVQISLGSAQNNMHLRQKEIQDQYRQQAKENDIVISSLAIGELNNIPFKSATQTEQWVSDSIDVATRMGCKVILLAFFSKGDLRGDEEGIKEVIRRLKKIAPKAEKAGIILGIESWLSADEHLRIIKAVGSKNVRVYYDVANATEMGYDIFDEMRRLGKAFICEVHLKENGHLLGQGKVDFVKVKKVLDEIGYDGWVVIEGGVPNGAGLFESCVANTAYIRSVFT
ncbi:sugar phosphate isomerase/epimerase family protein [Pedobacter heparinus]|uniref:sugar phosphate isomerase/epimerase family protein n=1 Tax=Pedobacter heparinus TaxID=984 RepID=UPI0029308884|nr:sugar phosphate isomerase/epimerase family protein [Pedobacter heparinus]